MGSKRLPPGCGADLDKPLLYNVYQDSFQKARRLRWCLACKTAGSTDFQGRFVCPKCGVSHTSNLIAPRQFSRLMLRAGRRSGKSVIGAHAVREELLVPGARWWVAGPTFKILHDASMPTLLRLIPPNWVKNWSQDNLELELINDAMVQFRSLDDPERARGQGLNGVWLDEAAFMSKRAWEVLEPSLTENLGIAIATTSPAGFDWSYDEFMKRAVIDHEPGYWAARFRTIDNPLFQSNPQLRAEVEHKRKTLPPDVFSAEYEGEDVNFTGTVYDTMLVRRQILPTEEAVKKLIPEWPEIAQTRQLIVGMDSGSDHPFGAVLMVVTPAGLVVVREYLERLKALTLNLSEIQQRFRTGPYQMLRWAANKNEANLRLEFGLRNVGVIPAESSHQIGIERVKSWLFTKQLYFAYTVPKTIEQMTAYRYADNYTVDGQKKVTEQVFKKNDELPDALRYAIMSWPELPAAPDPEKTARDARIALMDEKSRYDLMRWERIEKTNKGIDLEPVDDNYPIGDFFTSFEDSNSVFDR